MSTIVSRKAQRENKFLLNLFLRKCDNDEPSISTQINTVYFRGVGKMARLLFVYLHKDMCNFIQIRTERETEGMKKKKKNENQKYHSQPLWLNVDRLSIK